MIEEKRLLRFARQLDTQALAQIYDIYSPALYRYAVRYLGDVMLAEDCVAETFSRFLHALSNGGGPKKHLQAYLYRIAHNWIIDHYRKNDRTESSIDLGKEVSPRLDEDLLEDAVFSDETARVRNALLRLTDDQQQVIILKFLEGWSNKQVAEVLGKPIGAVKSLQHRGLGALRRALELQDVK